MTRLMFALAAGAAALAATAAAALGPGNRTSWVEPETSGGAVLVGLIPERPPDVKQASEAAPQTRDEVVPTALPEKEPEPISTAAAEETYVAPGNSALPEPEATHPPEAKSPATRQPKAVATLAPEKTPADSKPGLANPKPAAGDSAKVSR